MSRAIVVCESMFGNTKAVAESIAVGLREHVPVDVVEVSAAPTGVVGDVLLLVVGGPTQAFSMSRADSRRAAGDEATQGLVSTGTGLREWLERLQYAEGVRTAAFDTRMKKAFLPGPLRGPSRSGSSAAVSARSRRRSRSGSRGCRVRCARGELDRARAWGERLGAATRAG